MNLQETDWVLHLDEETIVDEHTVKNCIDFAEQQDQYDLGQGVIFYNAFGFWRQTLITFADIVRARDDLGKFYFAHNYFHVPVFGIHGSFLFINGKLENQIGWDTESLVEDFWFGIQAWNKGYKLGWIRSIAREQSPMTVLDLCKQRRRWFSGMLQLPGIWGRLACLQWCLSSVGATVM
ncbi:uncharacterized protein LY89DRAFT_744129 [Mollisia scopiformis]|uniref:Glycosyltransferase 2-like domain-containing protein n=1 Tax=Mollisia scopiformis TaxID=149040 RepID=A0A194XU61_MOLSC|nr:uncharacterized protein LY89DRAFT_744129 [Mollisia scopiformis]KUJ23676.1 hypothetical protein LY89DRAFT_744129 [Mollisia scopiformis]